MMCFVSSLCQSSRGCIMRVLHFTLLSCVLLHLQLTIHNVWLFYFMSDTVSFWLRISQGLVYLLYPVFGWIAEVWCGNFRMIQLSFVVTSASNFFLLSSSILNSTLQYKGHFEIVALYIMIVITSNIGLGMFEANAIQFGMDQMLDASSDQLSSFIHWYFWCSHVGPLFIFYFFVGLAFYFFNCYFTLDSFSNDHLFYFGLVLAAFASVQLFITLFNLIYSVIVSHRCHIEQSTRHSLRTVYRVLSYSLKQRFPQKRSAFTYWENDIPSRIDFGKAKYGGPFTYEQVDDVKTFFRLLLLIVSLFGFHLLGDCESLIYYILYNVGCLSQLPLAIVMINPKHFLLSVVCLGVPVLVYLKKNFNHCLPCMLTRIWLGLFISFIANICQILIGYLISSDGTVTDINCSSVDLPYSPPPLMGTCLFINIRIQTNDTCSYLCNVTPVLINLTFYLSIIPLVLYGISYVLVFLTTLEFICAQAPNTLKGLLVGTCYSMFSIKHILVNNFDTDARLLAINPWNAYNGVKGLGIFVSIVVFSLVYMNYRYRERNEVVSEQAIIEEQYERELLLNDSQDSLSLDGSVPLLN